MNKNRVVLGPIEVRGPAGRDADNGVLLQYSIHHVKSALLKNEVKEIINFTKNEALDRCRNRDIFIITVMQKALLDLADYGEEAEKEKERLLQVFVRTGRRVCDALELKGFYADYVDPCSGLTMAHQCSYKMFNEVQFAQSLLGYQIMNAGCCKILLHPKWGSAVYPASIIVLGDEAVIVEEVRKILDSVYES